MVKPGVVTISLKKKQKAAIFIIYGIQNKDLGILDRSVVFTALLFLPPNM